MFCIGVRGCHSCTRNVPLSKYEFVELFIAPPLKRVDTCLKKDRREKRTAEGVASKPPAHIDFCAEVTVIASSAGVAVVAFKNFQAPEESPEYVVSQLAV